jgi:nitroreductase/NAD-dependent dihydropyrimidine dehydrogenase PreA subunit
MTELHPRQIEIDLDKCDREGLCVRVCPWVFARPTPDDYPVVADPAACYLCGHCVAVCPSGAITHHELDMSNFPPAGREMRIQPDRLLGALRARRSYRSYNHKRKVHRATIERLIEAARYSPTGSNAQTLAHVVVQDPDTLGLLTRLCLEEMRARHALSQDARARSNMTPDQVADLESWVGIFNDVIEADERGEDQLFYNAPGVIISHAPREGTSCPVEDATLAAFHMMLMAESLGLGTCYIGNFYELMKDSPKVRDLLGIPAENDILMCFTFGYPAVRYRRLVDRAIPQVTWL